MPKENVVVCFGDYEQKQHMKFKEPTKGYKTFLIDEFRTSCRCLKCEGGEYVKFMKRGNPKPFKDNLITVDGLLRCKTCESVWNRDVNGATNINKIARNTINGIDRPSYLCRGNNQ